MKKLKKELLMIRILLCAGVILIGLCAPGGWTGFTDLVESGTTLPLTSVGFVVGIILALAGAVMMMRGYRCPHCGHPLSPKEDYLKNCPKCKRPFGE